MEGLKSVEELCVQHKMSHKQLADKAGLDEQRVLAIVLGRWTPRPRGTRQSGDGLWIDPRPDCVGAQDADSAHLWTWAGVEGHITRSSAHG